MVFGCLLPDLLDKPLWLATQWFTGAHSSLFATPRNFGHSVFLALALALAATAMRTPWIRALACAVPTHLLLDVVTDYGLGGRGAWLTWLFWPLRIPLVMTSTPTPVRDFASEATSVVCLAGELIGAALLLRHLAQRRREKARIPIQSDADS